MSNDSKQPDFPSLIVSVESRKGGVGKTTAALCLGRLLYRQGYSVLVLDMDVTGTNAADIANSPFWSSDINVIKQTLEERDKPPADLPANLLSIFDECFMTGRSVPTFSVVSQAVAGLLVDLDRVNVLGSQIYRTEDKKKQKNETANQGQTCLERPSVLFDDLHTLWLLDFIQQLASDFCRVVHNTRPSCGKVAIILDNSPGYVGIAPAIHEWLTDCGPDIGKFLNVTSLDAQDLQASSRGISVLLGLFQTKWETSRLYIRAKTEGASISVSKEKEAFFMRLATSGTNPEESDPLVFYKTVGKNKADKIGEAGAIFLNEPRKYIGLIVNRVPRAVKRGYLTYEFSGLPIKGFSSVVQMPTYSEETVAWREHMVSYDEYIENQFLLPSLQRGKRRLKRRLNFLIESIEIACRSLGLEIHKTSSNAALFGFEGGKFGKLHAQLIKSNELVTRVRADLEYFGLHHLARLIRDEWMPGSIVPAFRNALSELLRESEFMHFELLPFEMDVDLTKSEGENYLWELKKNIEKDLKEFSDITSDQDRSIVDTLLGVLLSLVALSFPSPLWHPKLLDELGGLLAGILSIEVRHWKENRATKSSRQGVQRFLAQESISNSEFEKQLMMSRGFRFFHHMIRSDSERGFIDFYKVCTSAQARLIDFAADSQFLLRLIQYMVQQENDKGGLFPFVSGLAEEVIELKTVSHEEAPDKMARALQSAEYFKEFDQVLNRILKNWGVANG